jgi:hypothetical protein
VDIDADEGGKIVELEREVFEAVGGYVEVAEVLKGADLWREVCDLVTTYSRTFSNFQGIELQTPT